MEKSFRNDKIHFANVSGSSLYHQRRSYKDGELLFLVNSSLTETAKGHFSLRGKNLIELDAMSGELFTYQSTQKGDRREGKLGILNYETTVLNVLPESTSYTAGCRK